MRAAAKRDARAVIVHAEKFIDLYRLGYGRFSCAMRQRNEFDRSECHHAGFRTDSLGKRCGASDRHDGCAKVLTTEIALRAGEKLFELAGTQSTLAEHGLDRHWRNARTHTLHDPVRWKYHLVGNYYLNGVRPARHAWN